MRQSTEFVGLKFTDRLARLLAANHFLIRCFIFALCGFFYSRAGILGVTGAFGGALTAAIGYDYTLPTCLGAVLGYLLVDDPTSNMGFIGMAIVVTALKLLVGEKRWNLASRAPAMLAGVSAAAVGIFPLIFTYSTVYDWVIWTAQIVLSSATAYFAGKLFVAGEPVFSSRGRMSSISLTVCAGVLAAGLTGLNVFGVSVGRSLAVLAVVAAGFLSGPAAGAGMGAAAGFAVGFVTGDFSSTIALYALGGLLAGAFSPLGRLGSAAAFVVTGGFAALTAGVIFNLNQLLEILAGTVLFMIIPTAAMRRAAGGLMAARTDDFSYKKLLAARLDGTVRALRDICETTRQVSGRLETMAAADISAVHEAVASRVCRRCGKNGICWQKYYDETSRALARLVGQIKREGSADAQALDPLFLQRCTRTEELETAATEEYHQFTAREGTRRKVSRVRSVVTDQFEGMAMFLSGLRRQMEQLTAANPALSARIQEYLTNQNLDPLWVVCLCDRYDRMTVEIQLPAHKLARADRTAIALELGEITDREFELPEVWEENGAATLAYWEKAAYTVAVGGEQVSCTAGGLCGDSYRSFVTQGSRCHIILSDGMGSGGSAAVDSAMASSLIARLARAGLDYDSALRLVNSALLVKSGEESLATIDVTCIDLYTGRAEFYKAGAAPTVVRKSGKGGSVESTSIPAGILKGVSFEHSGITLHEGDWVVMMSDGASVTGVEWITAEVESYRGDDPEELAKKLASAARLRRVDGRADDVTVVCARLKRGV